MFRYAINKSSGALHVVTDRDMHQLELDHGDWVWDTDDEYTFITRNMIRSLIKKEYGLP